MSDDDDDWHQPLRPPSPRQQQPRSAPNRSRDPEGDSQRAAASAPKLLFRPKNSEQNTEKEAEYAAARARIFGYGGNSSNGGRGQGRGRGAGGSARGSGQLKSAHSNDGYAASDKPRARRAADDDDPDYDRNPNRYAPRLAPPEEPMPNGRRYVAPTYDAEFPSLG
eukprot:TRINITY_DN4810_c0_g1_i1.p1 TRINITY_DN4810_c0_g1~~TRINITY_DN4810_c0_g1_i1.p1  ORF type:complete len:166 (-),score=24.68 TRINITY_DN4810_c0_g1_i1:180-677(-)